MVPDILSKVVTVNINQGTNKKFKDTEIGKIPLEWRVVKTGDVCTSIVPGRNKPKIFDGDIPWITIPDVDSLTVSVSKTGLAVSREELKKAKGKTVPPNTVIMTCVGTFGIAAVSTRELVINQQLHGFVCKDEILPLYLCWVLRAKEAEMISLAGKTTIPYLNREKCESIRFALPPLHEQKKIAEILSSVDEAIASTQAVINQTRKVKQGLLQQLLTRGIAHTRFKDSAIGKIPATWEVSTIGESCFIENNSRKPINAETRAQMQGIYPYYGPTGIVDYLNEYRLQGQYVLIGEDGDHFLKYETWSMTQLVEGQFNVNNHAHILRGKDYCSNKWLFHFFRHRNIVPHLTRQGAGRYKLNKATLCELKLALPPLEEQKEISKILDSIDKTNESSLEELRQYQQLKRGLMQDLLTGRVRVGVTP